MTDFDWPCDKRTAHGPHDTPSDLLREFCPGVKAHPDTMIGRPTGTPEPDLLDRIDEFPQRIQQQLVEAYPVIAQVNKGYWQLSHTERVRAFRRVLQSKNLRRVLELILVEHGRDPKHVCTKCGMSLLHPNPTAGSPPRPMSAGLEDGRLVFDCPEGGGHVRRSA